MVRQAQHESYTKYQIKQILEHWWILEGVDHLGLVLLMKCDMEMAVQRLDGEQRRDVVTVMEHGPRAYETMTDAQGNRRPSLVDRTSYLADIDRLYEILNEQGVVAWWDVGRRHNDWQDQEYRN